MIWTGFFVSFKSLYKFIHTENSFFSLQIWIHNNRKRKKNKQENSWFHVNDVCYKFLARRVSTIYTNYYYSDFDEWINIAAVNFTTEQEMWFCLTRFIFRGVKIRWALNQFINHFFWGFMWMTSWRALQRSFLNFAADFVHKMSK